MYIHIIIYCVYICDYHYWICIHIIDYRYNIIWWQILVRFIVKWKQTMSVEQQLWCVWPYSYANESTVYFVLTMANLTIWISNNIIVVERGSGCCEFVPLLWQFISDMAHPYLSFEGKNHRKKYIPFFWIWGKHFCVYFCASFGRHDGCMYRKQIVKSWLFEKCSMSGAIK